MGSADAMYELITPLLQWWMAYERWIETKFGIAYREQCYASWKRVKGKSPWLPPVSAVDWVMQFMEKKGELVRPKYFVS